MSDRVIVSAVQMSSTPEVSDNLDKADALIRQAVDRGAQLVLLPENFAHMPNSEKERGPVIESDGEGPIQTFLSECARAHGIYLVGGSVPIAAQQAGKAYAASLCYGPDGSRVARYDKIHLFNVRVPGGRSYSESDAFEYGPLESNDGLFDTPWGRFAMTICYDLRFPELFRRVAAKEAAAFLVPAAFTFDTGKAHWECLLRARAVENLAFVIASNQHGQHPNGRRTWGHSMVLDPWGKMLDATESGDGIVLAELDLDRQKELRKEFPCLEHRRI